MAKFNLRFDKTVQEAQQLLASQDSPLRYIPTGPISENLIPLYEFCSKSTPGMRLALSPSVNPKIDTLAGILRVRLGFTNESQLSTSYHSTFSERETRSLAEVSRYLTENGIACYAFLEDSFSNKVIIGGVNPRRGTAVQIESSLPTVERYFPSFFQS